MKIKILSFVLLIFCAPYIHSDVLIATLDFAEEKGYSLKNKKILQDLLFLELSKNPEISLLEREAIDKILKEHELSLTGQMMNPSSAIKTGNILGAEYILYGRIYSVNNQTYINVKFVNCKSGKITGTVIVKDSPKMEDEFKDVVKQIAIFVKTTASKQSEK